MNTAVAIASLASATAFASPAVSPAENSTDAGCLSRAEQMVSTLRERFVRPDWSIDEVAAERALRFFRAEAEGAPYDQDEYDAAVAFITDHGVSLDWIFHGNVVPTICYEAAASPRSRKIAAAADPIFAAIEAHRSAYAEYEKANEAPSRMHDTHATARVCIGYNDEADVTKSKLDEHGAFTITLRPTGKKSPLYAYDRPGIEKSAPRDLDLAARDVWIADRVAELKKEEGRIAKARARTKLGKLEVLSNEAYERASDRLWYLIQTMPTTADGLAALLEYCRANGGISSLVRDDWEDLLEWTIECSVCALAGLAEPPMNDVVAELLKDEGPEEQSSVGALEEPARALAPTA